MGLLVLFIQPSVVLVMDKKSG